MTLPSNCRRITKREKTIGAESLRTQDYDDTFFAVYDDTFLELLGSQPSIETVIEQDWPFAHEAGVYDPSQDVVFITSNSCRPDGATEKTIIISKVSRRFDGTWSLEKVPTDIPMGNGAINYDSQILFCAQGTKSEPGGLVLMESRPPYKTETLVDGFHGRLFNSVNDVVVHTDGSIWFTDPIYGFEQGFRKEPQLPCQVYRFEPDTGAIRVVADGFGRPNGISFSPDEQTVYITDTDWIHGDGSMDLTRASTIYAFDIVVRQEAPFLANRRVFAMADTGIPDGIKCDLDGNVYSGCGDGISVWSQGGKLLGKIMVGGGVANFCFGMRGEMFLLNENRFLVVKINENVQGALLANMGKRM